MMFLIKSGCNLCRDENNFVDVSDWDIDPQYDGVFPQGAREKTVYFSPTTPPFSFLSSNFRYMFKESSHRYPWQFYIEVLCCQIGKYLGIPVPDTFLAYNGVTYGALIKWFYDDNDPSFMKYLDGGDFLPLLVDDFDNKTGKGHNYQSVFAVLYTVYSGKYQFDRSNFYTFFKMLVFDCLIGNTDRHQENWGLCFFKGEKGEIRVNLAPAFDNGTSFAHEIIEKNIATKFKTVQDFERYILKGRHHMTFEAGGKKQGHIEFISVLANEDENLKKVALEFLEFKNDGIRAILEGMVRDNPVLFSPERCNLMYNLFEIRKKMLLNELNG